MFGRRKRTPSPRSADLTAFVGEGSEIEGTYTFRGTVMLNGRFGGEISTTDTLIVGDKGAVKATVHTGTLLVSGEVVGSVVASERVEIRAGGRLVGDVDTPVLVIEEGGVLDGQCRMTRSKTAEQSAVAPVRDLSVVKR